jgi:digeranylgeranylglycerophospholipid reductase
MKTSSEMIVVGGGPCGSFTALNLARRGVDVSVFEEHRQIGVPSHCAGHLSINGLKCLGLYPLPNGIVENSFRGVVFHSPVGKEFSIRFPSSVTCVLNRTLFDKHIAKMAEGAGALCFLDSRIQSLIIEDSIVKGVVVSHGGKSEEIHAKIVVDAEGVSSRLLEQIELASPNKGMLINGVEAEVENAKDLEQDMVEAFLGKKFASGLYAWIIPKGDGRVGVGLGAKSGNPKKLLEWFMFKHPVASKKLGSAKILNVAFHPIPLGGMIPKAYDDGFLAVGDCASQVKPTTGGGVVLGLNCARVAAETSNEALQKNDFSSGFLSAYQRRCEKILGFDVRFMLKARRLLNSMSDEKLDDVISFCCRFGLDKVFQNVEDMDFQGRSLLRTLRRPRMTLAFLYLLLSWLSTNV